MLSPDLVEFAKDRIAIEVGEREKQVSIAIQTIIAQHNARGVLRSSMTILEVQKICVQETHGRVELAWNVIYRGLTTLATTYDTDLEKELRELIESHFPEHMNGLKYHVQEMRRKLGCPIW